MSLTEANTIKEVAVVMGSDSDLKTLQPAVAILDQFGISNEVRILSAHRTPKEMMDFAQMAESNGFGVIIAGAGGAAHLPGMIASFTTLPVRGVPVKSKALSGIDSMYSILQMPSGIPVATVAIEGGLNAGLLATQILAVNNTELTNKLKNYRSDLHDLVVKKDQRLKDIGAKTYLGKMSCTWNTLLNLLRNFWNNLFLYKQVSNYVYTTINL